MNDSHHARLLLAVLRERRDEEDELRRKSAPDAARFATLCRTCDVHGWVRERLALRPAADAFAGDVVRQLGDDAARIRRDNMVLLAQAERAIDVLLEAGVNPVALKGLDLLHRAYPRLDQRTLDDIDLLVEPRQFSRAAAALERGGWTAPAGPKRRHYMRSSHHLPLRGPGPIVIDLELHWNLAQETRFRIDAAGLVARARPLDIGGRTVLRLSDEDFLAHLLLHQFTHYFERRLKWAVDLRVLQAESAAWPGVVERVRSWHAGAACAASVVHLRKLLPEAIPAAVETELSLAGWRRALAGPLRSGHPLELYRGTHRRWVQLYLAAVLMEQPTSLPSWLLHRLRRRRDDPSALDN